MRPNIPAVAVAHPGASYKPTIDDYKDNILAAAEIEYKKEDLKEKIDSELSYPKELDDLVETEYLYDTESTEDEDFENADIVGIESEKPKKKIERGKTRAEINRKKKLKQTLHYELTIKQQKALAKQFNKIKDLEKEIIKKEVLDGERRKLRDQIKELKRSTRPKKLSRYAFQPTPIEVKLADEIANSLRRLKPEGNLVKDRFKSFEARNLIETRIPVKKKRKYKQKIFESHDYKRFQ
jgi:nucleolar protein 53